MYTERNAQGMQQISCYTAHWCAHGIYWLMWHSCMCHNYNKICLLIISTKTWLRFGPGHIDLGDFFLWILISIHLLSCMSCPTTHMSRKSSLSDSQKYHNCSLGMPIYLVVATFSKSSVPSTTTILLTKSCCSHSFCTEQLVVILAHSLFNN